MKLSQALEYLSTEDAEWAAAVAAPKKRAEAIIADIMDHLDYGSWQIRQPDDGIVTTDKLMLTYDGRLVIALLATADGDVRVFRPPSGPSFTGNTPEDVVKAIARVLRAHAQQRQAA